MSRKILFVSNTANFSKFNRPFMRWFRQQDWQVDYASAGEEAVNDCDNQYTIHIARRDRKSVV
jgi:glycosyltransferase EpsD